MILIDENAGSAATVEYVFQVLSATYGESWSRAQGKAPTADVMTVWGNALDGFSHSKNSRRAITWALNNLPERCPNVIEFRSLCRQAPAIEAPAIEAPRADPVRVAAELAKLSPLRAQVPQAYDSRAWARKILANPEGRTPTVIQMARNAVEFA
jgi:hypothetical protein